MPFQCCQMGLVKLIGQIYQLLFDQCEQTKDMTRFLNAQVKHTEEVASLLQAQAKHMEEMASLLKDIKQAQDEQGWFYDTIGAQIQAIELRTSMRMCSPVDAIRHISQEASGEIWGGNQECYQVAAQMLQAHSIFSRGQLPVMADISRGKFFAAQEVLRRHQLLSELQEWQDGTVAFSLPSIQSKLIQASGNGEGALTRQQIDQVLGINQQIRGELNQAIAQARPAHHTGDQAPVLPQDPQYINQIYEMLPRHAVANMFQGKFLRHWPSQHPEI